MRIRRSRLYSWAIAGAVLGGNALVPDLAAQAATHGSPFVHADGTTHWYKPVAVTGGIGWQAAHTQAALAGGYLATITSVEENDFVFSLIDDNAYWAQTGTTPWQGPWIGGVQMPGSIEPAGGWRWGEHESFASSDNWMSGKPDDVGAADRIHFHGSTSSRADEWADAPSSALMPGYVIEFSGPTAPRTVGLLQRDKGSFDGYTLFNPYFSERTFLVDPRGRVVNSWDSQYRPGMSAYLLKNGNMIRAGSVKNTRFTAGGNGGILEEFDWQGQLVWKFDYSSQQVCQHHDFEVLPNGNILMIAWELKTKAEAIAAGRADTLLAEGELWPEKIIEIKPDAGSGGTIVWSWHMWDHLIQDFDSSKANYGNVGKHPELIDLNFTPDGLADWAHWNSIAYNDKLDQIIVSSRSFDEIWIIDHSTTTAEAAGHTGGRSGKGGDLLYRWGNPIAYRGGTAADQRLFKQHDAHWIPTGLNGAGNILLFNNGQGRKPVEFSSADEIQLPAVDAQGNYPRTGAKWGPIAARWSHIAQHPTNLFSSITSSAQRLPNGNTLICAGVPGDLEEVTNWGITVWRYKNPYPSAGLATQGDRIQFNLLFRGVRYDANYAGLVGQTLTPGAPVEQYGAVLLADGSSLPRRTQIGSKVRLSVRAPTAPGATYLVGTGLTPGVLEVGYRHIRVGYDDLLYASVRNLMPSVFQDYLGNLDAQGEATATFAVPAFPFLIGIKFYSVFVIADNAAPQGISVISNTVEIEIEK